MSLDRAHRRQYTRRTVNVRAQLAVSDACLEQVALLHGASIAGQMTNISGGGGHVIVATYLPRATLLEVDLPATPFTPAGRIRARVMSVRMVDREPRYGLGLRFEDADCEIIRHLLAADARDAGKPRTADGGDLKVQGGGPAESGTSGMNWGEGEPRPLSDLEASNPRTSGALRAEAAEKLPAWMGLLQSAGLVSGEVLQAALREAGADSQRAVEWLVGQGCVSQRDAALAQAQAFDLPFVEPGEYRINLANRKLLPEELARVHLVFPFFVLDRIITLGAVRPLDLTVLDQIRLQTGCEIDPCLVRPRELQNLIEWAYGNFQKEENADGAARGGALVWDDILKDVTDAPAVKLVNVLMDQAAANRASDIHIDAEEHALHVRFRVDGVLREVPAPPKTLLPAIVARLKILGHMDIAETRKPQDGHFKQAIGGEELDVRISTLPSANGEAVVLRLLAGGKRLLSLEELGLDGETLRQLEKLIHLPHGMLLVTGPTGSGKTTTLYSALTRIDRVRHSVITLEDPVEIRLPQIRQVGVNAKSGLTFQVGLRALLRQDPDVILIGEIRDQETAEIALQAALTGHLLLSTLHTNSAAGAITRLLDMGVADFLASSALAGVLAQRLCRRLCRHCAKPEEEQSAARQSLLDEGVSFAPEAKWMKPIGCKRCGNTGYEGRVGIFELLAMNDEIRRAVLEGRDERTLAALAREGGMVSLVEDGWRKVAQGLTTAAELLRVAGGLEAVKKSASGAKGSKRQEAEGRAALSGLESLNPQMSESAAGFDVNAYERLLGRWLRPAAPAKAVL